MASVMETGAPGWISRRVRNNRGMFASRIKIVYHLTYTSIAV